MNRLFFTLSCLALTAVFFGCNKTPLPDGMPPLVPCEVTVMQDGYPLSNAIVTLSPVDGDPKWSASGNTDELGIAKLYTWSSYEGVAEGKYKLTIGKTETEKLPPQPSGSSEPSKIPKSFSLVEERFGNSDTTPLEITVVKGTKNYEVDASPAVKIEIVDSH